MVNIYTLRYIISAGKPRNANCLCQVSGVLDGANRGSSVVIITHEPEQTGHWKI